MRIRTVKPEFFNHEAIFEAERQSGLPLRLAFIGLWCAADRCGRFKWEPRRLGVQILPYDGVDFSRVLHALATRGFVVKYRVGDACFGAIPSFEKHQIINNKESASTIPPFDDGTIEMPNESGVFDACPTREPRVTDACHKEGKGKERNKEGNGSHEVASLGIELLDPEEASSSKKNADAKTVLRALNEIAGRSYRETQTNLDFIRARLAEKDVTVDGCIEMIRRQTAKWGADPKMSEFLRPETLFNRTKFDSYYSTRAMPVLDQSANKPSQQTTRPEDDWRNSL